MSMYVLYNQQSLIPIQVGINIDELLMFQNLLDTYFKGYYAVDSVDNYASTIEKYNKGCLSGEVYIE